MASSISLHWNRRRSPKIELLADAQGDARVRAPVRGARRRQRRVDLWRQWRPRSRSTGTAGDRQRSNFSLMPKEMLACGLPCVELAGVSAESIFGANGVLDLAPLEPQAIARDRTSR